MREISMEEIKQVTSMYEAGYSNASIYLAINKPSSTAGVFTVTASFLITGAVLVVGLGWWIGLL